MTLHALEQGDIIELNFSPSIGHEPTKMRQAIVVSGYGFNSQSSLSAVVPITSTDNGYPLHIPVTGSNDINGFACVEQLRNVDIAHRGYRYIGYASDSTMKIIMGCIRGIFEL